MTDATKATPLSADIQPKIGEYTSPGVQTPPPAIPQDQLTGKTHGVRRSVEPRTVLFWRTSTECRK